MSGRPMLPLARTSIIMAVVALLVSVGLGHGRAITAAAGYTTSATVQPASVAAGATATVTASVTSSTSSTVLVDVEIYSATGARVFQQFWDNQSLGAGVARTYSAPWAVPASQTAGTYTVKIGIFAPGWSSTQSWNDNAAQFAVTSAAPPAAAFTTSATVSPSSAPAGSTFTITATATSSTTLSALVDVEIYGPGGVKAFQQFWDNQSFNAGQARSYTATWATPASQTAGAYTVKTGLFKPGWASTLAWNDAAAQFSIAAAPPGATATPTPRPTTTPSATPSPTPVSTPTPVPPSHPSMSGLHTQGNQILNGAGQAVRLHGVNRSGTEYACIQGWGIFDGPSDTASLQAIASWKANAVRVPLNEDCWLGINGAAAAYSGSAYQQAITNYVNLITSSGLAAIVDLHWNAPGAAQATGQQPMPDQDHAPAFWSQVASTFKNNSAVVLELYNEPYPDNNQDTTAGWTCWRDGGSCAGVAFQVAGMQSLVNTVRATGAANVILLGGLEYSNALSQWLTYAPSDPGHNLAAAWHVYNFNACSNTSCYSSVVGPVAARVPIVTTEIGENDCSAGFVTPLMNWLDGQGQSYLAWTWDTWGTACGSIALVSSYSGTPATAYGQGYHDHLAALP